MLIVLANTVLFNCTSIVVEGNQRYTSEEIIKQSGLEKGMNLLHIDEDQAEQRIISALAYIDIADVVKVFPTKLKISVTEAETWFAVRQDGRSVTISRLGKVVQQSASHGLPVVTGIEAKLLDTGALLESEIPAKTDMPKQVLEAAEKYSITGIREIDITDRFSIVLYCENEVTLQIGGVADLDSKMHEASRLFKGDKILMQNVTVNLENPEKIYVVSNVEEELIPELPENGTQEASTAQAGSPEHVSEVPAA